MDSYFCHAHRFSGKRKDDEEKVEIPTELLSNDVFEGFSTLSTDMLSFKMIGSPFQNMSINDFEAAQSNHPVPNDSNFFYCEFLVKDSTLPGALALGFARKCLDLFSNSCFYEGETGNITCLVGGSRAKHVGHSTTTMNTTYSTGDVIGVGINYVREEFFFTKNGVVVHRYPKELAPPLYPTVILQSRNQNAVVKVNFIPDFVFDFEAYKASVINEQKREIEDIVIPPRSTRHQLVRDYLIHYGYGDTLQAFNQASGEADVDDYTLNDRKSVREFIRKGHIDGLVAMLESEYPEVVEDNKSEVSFLLHCQKYIEFIRSESYVEALDYAKKELKKFDDSPLYKEVLDDLRTLLGFAVQIPEDSSVTYLLGKLQKDVVADGVNAAILFTNPSYEGPFSRLEMFLKHLSTCSLKLHQLSGYGREIFSLNRFLNSN